jgi:alpha-tubulin suppressor-like RCC1 family protein
MSFTSLEHDLLCHIVFFLDVAHDIANLECTCLTFRGTEKSPTRRSVVEDGLHCRLRCWAKAESLSDPALVTRHEPSRVQYFLWGERNRRARAPSLISAGSRISAVVDTSRRLCTFSKAGSLVGIPGRPPPLFWPLGQGSDVVKSVLPACVVGLEGVAVASVAVGSGHTLVCSSIGEVYSFGYGSADGAWGALGHGGRADCHSPCRVAGLNAFVVVLLAAGRYHSLVLTRGGLVLSFGANFCGQLGRARHMAGRASSHVPCVVESLRHLNIVGIAAGGNSSFAWSGLGGAYSFGQGSTCMGHSASQHPVLVPMEIAALIGIRVSVLSASQFHCLAVCFDVQLYSWGRGDEGQLGNGDDMQCHYTPGRVQAFMDLRVLSVAAGMDHSIVLCDSGVFTFGHRGDLGYVLSSFLSSGVPRRIGTLNGKRVSSIHAGPGISYAVTALGDVYNWGADAHKLLNRSRINSFVPRYQVLLNVFT